MAQQDLSAICSQIRRDIIRMVHGVQSGHPGGSLGCVEYFVNLYFSDMKINPEKFDMNGHGEDLFFLSNGHISPVWYSVLARRGYFPVSELASFRKLNTRLQGHPATKEGLPGIRVASGSLGQGLSVAIGAAQMKKLNGDDRLVYTLHGDGEMQEGQIWEAAMYAAHYKVDNLISAIDWNGQQIDGPVEEVMDIGDLKAKWLAFGWDTFEINGNDLQSVQAGMAEARSRSGKGKPVMILMRTVMGKGVDFMENDHNWHGVAPNNDQLAAGLAQLAETLGDY